MHSGYTEAKTGAAVQKATEGAELIRATGRSKADREIACRTEPGTTTERVQRGDNAGSAAATTNKGEAGIGREKRKRKESSEETDDAARIMRLEAGAFDTELRRRYGDFMGQVGAVGRRWAYPLRVSLAHRYVAPRLALVGDAAHGLHPLAGQNLNLGYRDIAALAEVLIDAARLGLDIGEQDVLRRYEAWRRFDNLTLLAVTDGLNRLFSNDVAPIKLARGLGLAAVHRIPGVKKFLMSHARGTVGAKPRLLEGQAL